MRFTEFGIPSDLVASWGAQQGAGDREGSVWNDLVLVCIGIC